MRWFIAVAIAYAVGMPSFQSCLTAYDDGAFSQCDAAWCRCVGVNNISKCSNEVPFRTARVHEACSSAWSSCAHELAVLTVPVCLTFERDLCLSQRPAVTARVIDLPVNASAVCDFNIPSAVALGCVLSLRSGWARCVEPATPSTPLRDLCTSYITGFPKVRTCADQIPPTPPLGCHNTFLVNSPGGAPAQPSTITPRVTPPPAPVPVPIPVPVPVAPPPTLTPARTSTSASAVSPATLTRTPVPVRTRTPTPADVTTPTAAPVVPTSGAAAASVVTPRALCEAAGVVVPDELPSRTETVERFDSADPRVLLTILPAIAVMLVMMLVVWLLFRCLNRSDKARLTEVAAKALRTALPDGAFLVADPEASRDTASYLVRLPTGALRSISDVQDYAAVVGSRQGATVYRLRVGERSPTGGYQSRNVVLKRLACRKGDVVGMATAMDEEVERLAAFGTPLYLRSPYLASYAQVAPEVGGLIIARQYAEGPSLYAILLQCGPLTEQAAALVVRDALRGLVALHARGVVHGNIKLTNLFHVNGVIMHTDFGFVPALMRLGANVPRPFYPDNGFDFAADVAAVGLLTVELLTGKPAFRHNDFRATGEAKNLTVEGEIPYASARQFIQACTTARQFRPTADQLLQNVWVRNLPPDLHLPQAENVSYV